MSTSITFNGVGYTIPAEGDNYGDDLSSYLVAIASGALQKTGGTFTLSAEVNFGATYGLKSVYLKSQATNPASTGIIRLGNAEAIGWRNAANNADLSISVNASNKFTFNSIELADISSVQTLTNKTLTAPVLSSPTGLVKSDVGLGNVDNTSDATKNAAAVTLTNKTIDAASNTISNIVNTNISASAAIAYSKLNLATSIVNADISASAAIAYSKLNLSTSILNADINASAAIARTKLSALTTSRAMVTDGSGFDSVSAVTSTELGYVSGVTSSIQTQINAKQDSSTAVTLTGTQALTNKDIDGGTASNARRITLPKETTANLSALTRKAGTLVFDTSTLVPYFDNGTSLVAIQAASAAVVFQGSTSAANNITTSTAPVTFTAVTDTNSGWSTDTYTIPSTAKYNIHGHITLASDSFTQGHYIIIEIYKLNTTTSMFSTSKYIQYTGTQQPESVQIIALGVALTAGDTIQLRAVTQAGTRAMSAFSIENWFSIVKVG